MTANLLVKSAARQPRRPVWGLPCALATSLLLLFASATAQSPDAIDQLLQRERQLMAQSRQQPENFALTKEMAGLRAEIAQRKARTGDRKGALSYLYNSLRLDPERPDLWEQFGDLANFIESPASDDVVQYGYEEALAR
jgi:hypothetical protein